MSAAPSNSGGPHVILAQVQVLLNCAGFTGGDGMPVGREQGEKRE